MKKKDEKYRLSMWACLEATLREYSITPILSPKIWEHIMDDLMELLEKQGYVEKKKR